MTAGGRHGPGRGRRALTTEERALWRGVVRSIKPLRGRAAREADDSEHESASMQRATMHGAKAKHSAKPAAPASQPVRSTTPPPASLARRDRQRLARGSAPIDARIDLHGMTQAEAHIALAHFLRRAQRNGARFVLVITGKGAASGSASGERGVLRRQVPLWLGLPEFRAAVVGFEEAHVAHGGEGALYVRLRRTRDEG